MKLREREGDFGKIGDVRPTLKTSRLGLVSRCFAAVFGLGLLRVGSNCEAALAAGGVFAFRKVE